MRGGRGGSKVRNREKEKDREAERHARDEVWLKIYTQRHLAREQVPARIDTGYLIFSFFRPETGDTQSHLVSAASKAVSQPFPTVVLALCGWRYDSGKQRI